MIIRLGGNVRIVEVRRRGARTFWELASNDPGCIGQSEGINRNFLLD